MSKIKVKDDLKIDRQLGVGDDELVFEKKIKHVRAHIQEKKILYYLFFVKPCFQPTVHPTNLVSLCSPVISYKWLPFLPFPFFFF